MRFKNDNVVRLCVQARSSGRLLLLTTAQGELFTVDCVTVARSNKLFMELLAKGYIDISEYTLK